MEGKFFSQKGLNLSCKVTEIKIQAQNNVLFILLFAIIINNYIQAQLLQSQKMSEKAIAELLYGATSDPDPIPQDSSSKNSGLPAEAFIITGGIIAVVFIVAVLIAVYCIKKSYRNGNQNAVNGEYMINLGDEMVGDEEEEDEEEEEGKYQNPVAVIF